MDELWQAALVRQGVVVVGGVCVSGGAYRRRLKSR